MVSPNFEEKLWCTAATTVQDDVDHGDGISDGDLGLPLVVFVAIDVGSLKVEVRRRVAEDVVDDGYGIGDGHLAVAVGITRNV